MLPTFRNSLVSIGPLCDAGYSVLFPRDSVQVRDPVGNVLLTGWREMTGPRLWRFFLLPHHPWHTETQAGKVRVALMAAFSAYDLPSVEALVRFYHASAGYPVKSTWLDAIWHGNYATWPSLTHANAPRYSPESTETMKGHTVQTRKGVRSTKPKPTPPSKVTVPASAVPQPEDKVAAVPGPTGPLNEIHVRVEHTSKLYTNDMGQFPVQLCKGNQYIMLAYHCNSNVILVEPFKSKSDAHRIAAYNAIMERLRQQGLSIDLQVLDNEASQKYRQVIKEKWKCKFQLVPPDVHRRNAAEQEIRTSKVHFLSVLAGINPSFLNYLWDLLLPQTKLTLNPLQQAMLKPEVLAWEYFTGQYNYDATPIGPLGCRVMIHTKTSRRKT